MHPVQKHLMDTEFRDLAGSRIEGTIALSDDLINLGLHEIVAKLQQLGQPSPTTEEAAPPTPASSADAGLDPKVLLKNLHVERLAYRTETGKTMLDIKAAFG